MKETFSKILSALTAFAVSLTILPLSGFALKAEASGMIYGDVNQDGKINIFDLTLLKKEIRSAGSAKIDQKAADVNSDGILNIYDIKEIQNFLLGRTDVFSGNIGKEISDDTDDSAISLPAVSSSVYQLSEGNSKAFEMSPLEGLTVSAEKNALDYDGQLKFSEMSETAGKNLNQQLTDFGFLMIEGWNVNANLRPDEYLPKTFHSDYDLKTIDLPEELYDDVIVLRIDDEGNIQQYATEKNGSHISWDSSQNSFLVLGFLTTTGLAVAGKIYTIEALYWLACVAAGITITDWAGMYDKEHALNSKQMESLHCQETDDFVIWYSDEDENSVLRNKRIQSAESQAYTDAENMALDVYGSDYAAKLDGIKKLNERTIEFQKMLLADNKQYQADIAARDSIPVDVAMLEEQLLTADHYLVDEQKTGELGYKPDIIFTSSAQDSGNEQKPKALLRKAFMIVKRDPNLMKDSQLCKTGTPKGELYGNKINKEYADDMLITVTHEMFHMHQHKKYNGTDIASLDFSEFSANILEMQCAEYYQKNNLITTSYENTNIGGYETYAVPIDRNDIAPNSFDFNQDVLKAHGYTLSEFFIYLEEQTGKTLTAWKVVDAYSSNNMSNLRAIMKVFGITSKADLSKYWKGYLQSIADKLGNRTAVVKEYSSDGQAAMPSYLRKMTLGKNHPSEKITVTQANYSAKSGYVFCPDTDHYSVLFVRDDGFSSIMPTFGFGLSKPSGIKQSWQTIKNGVALTCHDWYGYFYERQGGGNYQNAQYTAYILEAPASPVLVYDDKELHAFHLNLQEAASKAGQDKITDCFRVIWKVNNQEVYSQLIDFNNWTDDIIVYPKDLDVSMTDQFELSVTVQEYIAASEKYKEFRGPESEPAVLKFGSDTPVIDTTFSYSSYYSVGKAGINYTGVDGVHFELKEDGTFKFTLPDISGEYDNSNPMFSGYTDGTCEEYAYDFKGFTATGRLTDMKDMSAWTAEIETCSPSSFYGYDKYLPYQYVDYWSGNDEKIYLTDKARDETWQGSISGKVQGTVEYSEQPYNNNPDSGMIIATIKISLDVPLTSAKGETMTDRSVMFTGSYTYQSSTISK